MSFSTQLNLLKILRILRSLHLLSQPSLMSDDNILTLFLK